MPNGLRCFHVPPGEIYVAVEAPKGEFCAFQVSDSQKCLQVQDPLL
ncbi:hypothetical protein ABTD98_22235, partial [Acinetobacter baumannii]